MNPRVQSVNPEDKYKLRLTFANGEVRIYDCSPLLDFGVFKELRDVAYFRQVRTALGTVVWPNEQDICPDTLYEDSRQVKDVSNEMQPTTNIGGHCPHNPSKANSP